MWITALVAIMVMGLVGALFGVMLDLLDRALKVYQDPMIEKIVAELPGINCGACGEVGCVSFAKAAVKNRSLGNGCLPGGADVNAKIASMLGLEHKGSDRLKVISRCLARECDQKKSFDYRGPRSCAAAHAVGGSIDCRFGCLGMGDCSAVCPVDAISVADGHAEVDEKRCIDCGRCVKVCPRGLFYFANIGSSKSYYAVGCNNTEPGPETKKVCAAGCIGCGLCTRVVPDSPFALDAKVSRLDYAKARDRDLDLAVERCPSKIIRKYSI